MRASIRVNSDSVDSVDYKKIDSVDLSQKVDYIVFRSLFERAFFFVECETVLNLPVHKIVALKLHEAGEFINFTIDAENAAI